jgi:predicted SAM-dependent methyltransferase
VSTRATPIAAHGVRRLNWGCGPHGAPGWINSDRGPGPLIDLVCDIRDGLPVPDDTFDYAVSIHALEQVPFPDAVPVLEELRRVLRPGGVLRLSVPDLDRAIDAYRRGDRAYFHVPDADAVSVGGKLCVQMTWYGTSRLLLTYDFLAELLAKAHFAQIRPCGFRRTESQFPGIVDLDDREPESLFVEAVK